MEERNLVQDSVIPVTRRAKREAALAAASLSSTASSGSSAAAEPVATSKPAAPTLTLTRAMLRELRQESVQPEPVNLMPAPVSVFDAVPTPEIDLSDSSQHMCQDHAAEEAAYSHRSAGVSAVSEFPTRSSLRRSAVAAQVSADPVVAVPAPEPKSSPNVEAALAAFTPVAPIETEPAAQEAKVAIPSTTRRAARQASASSLNSSSVDTTDSAAFSNSVVFSNSATSPAVHVWAPLPVSPDSSVACGKPSTRLGTDPHLPMTRSTALRRGSQRQFTRKSEGVSAGKFASRVAILASLAIATVATPMALANTAGPEPLAEELPAPIPLVGPSTAEVVAGAPLLDTVPIGISQLMPLDDRVVQVASRSDERTALSGCDAAQAAPGENGLLSQLDLCAVAQGHTLRADAAVAFAALDEAYTDHFGQRLCLVGSYRPLAIQQSLKIQKGSLAATPGTSNHGWGLAIDICNTGYQASDKWDWLNKNAPRYGWAQPSWASRSYEPWHWEFTAGVEAK